MSAVARAQENERIQSQIGVSIGLARNLVASWLPPMTEEEKRIEMQNVKVADNVLTNRRRPGAGLGSNAEKDESVGLSVDELKIKRRLLQKDKKLKEHARELLDQRTARKQKSSDHQHRDSSDDEELTSRSKGHKSKKSTKISLDAYVARKEKMMPKTHKGFGRP